MRVIRMRVKKTMSQQEEDLQKIIDDAKKKLDALKNKKRIELGSLACKYGLNNFELDVIEKTFKELSLKLNNEKK